ncbi:MAG: winged helix DNA-binding domain-containing protein [Actinomycetota bacterium]
MTPPADRRRKRRDAFAARVLARQHLAERARGGVVSVVRDLVGLHATSATTPYLSLLARMDGFAKEDLERELYEKRTLVRTRCMRTTVFVLPRELLAPSFAATSRTFESMSLRYLQAQSELAGEYERLSEEILQLVGDGSMTVAEIRGILGVEGHISPVVNMMCDRGLLVRDRPARGWRDAAHRYARLDRAYPDIDLRMDEAEATAEIIRRYLHAFGPVTETDAAWWAGLSKKRVRAALAHLGAAVVSLDVGLMLAEDAAACVEGREPDGEAARPAVALLPLLDPFLMGYKDRSRFLAASDEPFVFDRSGNASSTILVDGHIAGVWDAPRGKTPEVRLFSFRHLADDVRAAIEAEAGRVGRFVFERDPDVLWMRGMVPLRERGTSGFMKPLTGP